MVLSLYTAKATGSIPVTCLYPGLHVDRVNVRDGSLTDCSSSFSFSICLDGRQVDDHDYYAVFDLLFLLCYGISALVGPSFLSAEVFAYHYPRP